MGVMGFDPDTKQMILLGCFPGITPEEILDNMEFEIRTDQAKEVPVPTETELTLLREKCDPHRLIL